MRIGLEWRTRGCIPRPGHCDRDIAPSACAAGSRRDRRRNRSSASTEMARDEFRRPCSCASPRSVSKVSRQRGSRGEKPSTGKAVARIASGNRKRASLCAIARCASTKGKRRPGHGMARIAQPHRHHARHQHQGDGEEDLRRQQVEIGEDRLAAELVRRHALDQIDVDIARAAERPRRHSPNDRPPRRSAARQRPPPRNAARRRGPNARHDHQPGEQAKAQQAGLIAALKRQAAEQAQPGPDGRADFPPSATASPSAKKAAEKVSDEVRTNRYGRKPNSGR